MVSYVRKEVRLCMTIEEMKKKKTELGLTNKMIAEKSGIPVSTLQKLFSGKTKAPRKLTLDAVRLALDWLSAPQYAKEPAPQYAQEASFQYAAVSKEKLHTVEEYYALPDDVRVELIDGVFYDMAAPSRTHQMILGDLYLQFRECADRRDHTCAVFFAPSDVRLDRDNYTMVQPDLYVVCPESDLRSVCFEGAPDLCLEILSPSTRMKDMILKLHKYHRAGVREYWIVDPKHRTVTVHFFDEDYAPETYSFDDTIPVRISGGECSIDFSRIKEHLDSWGL